MNTRRGVIVGIGAGALMAPFTGFAQQTAKSIEKSWRVGVLLPRPRPASIGADFAGGFAQGMRERGYVDGNNLVIEWRFADGDIARLPGLANELVQLKVDAVVGGGPQAIRALQKATTTIPIVMAVTGNPEAEGFVASLARPGGNITGPTLNAGDIYAKRLEMLLEFSPRLDHVALLMNPDNGTHLLALASIRAAGKITKTKILAAEAKASKDIESAFALMKRENIGAVIAMPDGIFNAHVRQIADLALKQRLPLVSGTREYVDAGCLASYGASFRDNFHRAAYYVDRILKGTKPSDLPVEQPTKFELFINSKTAKALGLKIPQSLLISADGVIE